ncbi:plantacyanin [Actinidia rufa]|uniref:Plantacyanin n=1 Tax=Actinidia rufa TaxID=165716 RepID=A0A7J0EG42_9ERIC|nr:plantacyanin [Actinidia rufa]
MICPKVPVTGRPCGKPNNLIDSLPQFAFSFYAEMSQGSGSASTAMVIAIILLCLLIHTVPSHGATYTVGGPGGWTFNLSNWPKGKSFNAGDVLVFNYDPSYHNVVCGGQRRLQQMHNSG